MDETFEAELEFEAAEEAGECLGVAVSKEMFLEAVEIILNSKGELPSLFGSIKDTKEE